jgi:hypothetical protein
MLDDLGAIERHIEKNRSAETVALIFGVPAPLDGSAQEPTGTKPEQGTAAREERRPGSREPDR